MPKTCLKCIHEFYGDVCDICYDPASQSVEKIEKYRDYAILQYSSEDGFRVDLGAKRSKLVPSIEDARGLVDFHLSPDKWGRE
jgi:hypothetical protein